MRPSGKLSFLAILFCFAACAKSAKSSTEINQGGPGDWNLVSDSTFEGAGSTNHPVNYTGQAGDYFSFGTDGYVYTKEGEVLDTLTYRLVSATGVIISDFGIIINGIPDTSTITGLGTNSLTVNNGGVTVQTIAIESPFFPTPGGTFWRKVTLSR
jgi:hypothetical protein